MELKGNKIRLSSGREINTWGYLNISVSGNFQIAVGYDQELYFNGDADDPEDAQTHPLTPAEKTELAEFMIKRWRQFAQSHQ